MNTNANKYLFLTGKIHGGPIVWNVESLPAQAAPVDAELEAFVAATNAKFDAPCTTSFFAHLFPPRTDASLIVSRTMSAQMPIGTSNDYFWDGFAAQYEGQPLAAMPTEYHEAGWFNAYRSDAKAVYETNVKSEPVDGELQDAIDAANADECAEEWQEYFLDQEREGR